MSIALTLDRLYASGLDRLDAQRLLLHALGHADYDRAWLLAHDGDALTAAQQARLDALVQRHAAGEPMAYLLGHQAFYGLNLQVDARVLVPRPDTETLVDWALALLAAQPQARVADLGTGSGAIALALKAQLPSLQVVAIDASAPALAVAHANAQRLGLQIDWVQASWLAGVAGPFDCIVSNPPYIASGDQHLAALRHEPISALASGDDGLDDIRAIIHQASHAESLAPSHLASPSPSRLARGAWLVLEHGYDQAPAVRALLCAAGFSQVQSRTDLAGIERCSAGQWLPAVA
jgi:release factor glutamine methyltransferase